MNHWFIVTVAGNHATITARVSSSVFLTLFQLHKLQLRSRNMLTEILFAALALITAILIFKLTKLAFVEVACHYRLRLQAYSLRGKLGLKGPKVNLLLGNVLLFTDPAVKWNESQKRLFQKLKQIYGNVYGLYLGPQLNIVVTDLDLAKDILIKKFSHFTDRSHIAILENKPMSDCLFNLKQNEWKEVRCTVAHAFSNKVMRQMATASLPKIKKFIDSLRPYADSLEEFDIYKNFQVLTVDVIAQCAFALNLDGCGEVSKRFLGNCRRLFDMLFPELNMLLKMCVPFAEFSKAEQQLVQDLHALLLQKRVAKGIHLSDDSIIANAMVFLLAGYETSSTAMGFASWLLAKHRNVQSKLQEEIDKTFSNNADEKEFEIIERMPFLDAVFRETLRLFPPLVLLVVRTCVKACTIRNVKFVPGVQVLFPTFTIQRDEDVWMDAEEFKPERLAFAFSHTLAFICFHSFLQDQSNHHPMAWLPFGAGPRNCIGKRFAEIQFKITMIHLLRNYNLSLCKSSQDPIRTKSNGATIKPSEGVVLQITKRVRQFNPQGI
ncbi:protein CYP 25A3 [Trichuris trichiura]|uniref:Protein CYP 25A3 n=1 Tax=Trichuris trichiura TaxID=36087 RepID=A0A077ZB16_TRITR|nr:protein CYP 25A3 [Trichuris trichiura]